METFYIRVRGRVLGPYDAEKLKSLASRGQLSKMHDVSVDGVSWVRASTFPELFEGKLSDYAGDPQHMRDAPAADAPLGASGGESRPAPAAAWHYAIDGKQMPPTDLAGLQQLAGSGVVTPDTQVWQEGMQDWMPARTVPGLIWPAPSGVKEGSARKTRGDLPSQLCHTALGSRTWAMFLAIIGLAVGVPLTVLSVIWFLIAVSTHVAPLAFTSIWGIIQSALLVTGAWFLLDYAISLGELRYVASSSFLTKSLAKLRRFWMFVGITVIVVVAIIALAAIFVFTGAISMDYRSW